MHLNIHSVAGGGKTAEMALLLGKSGESYQWRALWLAAVAVTALSVSGCGSAVRMDPPTIPEPLMEPMDVTVGVRFPDDFRAFKHEEETVGAEDWSIDLGRSNEVLFTELFGYMFEKVLVLGPEDDPYALDLDAYIEPSIDAFEFSVPSQTKTDFFAVWIRYRIKVYNSEGEQIANWPLAAYGKSQASALGGSAALQRAAVLAMRDAAALMIDKLDRETGVGSTRASRQQAAAAPAEVDARPLPATANEFLPAVAGEWRDDPG